MQAPGHFVAAADNLFDIGAVGANRPRDIHMAGRGLFGGISTPSTSSPTLDVLGASVPVIVITNNIGDTPKNAAIAMRHGLAAEQELLLIKGTSTGFGQNFVDVGGGDGTLNVATLVRIFTAADDITLTGTQVGQFDFSTTARDTRFSVFDVDNNALERVTVGIADSGGVGFKLLRIQN